MDLGTQIIILSDLVQNKMLWLKTYFYKMVTNVMGLCMFPNMYIVYEQITDRQQFRSSSLYL